MRRLIGFVLLLSCFLNRVRLQERTRMARVVCVLYHHASSIFIESSFAYLIKPKSRGASGCPVLVREKVFRVDVRGRITGQGFVYHNEVLLSAA